MAKSTIWQFIYKELANNAPVTLIIVAKTDGSSPGKAGFKLAVAENGNRCGTIGGGKIESDMIQKAEVILTEKALKSVVINYSLKNDNPDDTDGMICGGSQTIIILLLLPEQIISVNEIISFIHSHQKGIITFDEKAKIAVDKSDTLKTKFPIYKELSSEKWIYSEPSGIQPIIHIVGGGHVSLALSRILSTLDYYIIVYDERSNLDTMINNKYADEKTSTPFSLVQNKIKASERAFILIMTPGHNFDEIVLRNTIKMNTAYIGMMASNEKREEILNKLRKDGFDNYYLQKLHCPVGLPIYSHTPEEIAISIAAELVMINNRPKAD